MMMLLMIALVGWTMCFTSCGVAASPPSTAISRLSLSLSLSAWCFMDNDLFPTPACAFACLRCDLSTNNAASVIRSLPPLPSLLGSDWLQLIGYYLSSEGSLTELFETAWQQRTIKNRTLIVTDQSSIKCYYVFAKKTYLWLWSFAYNFVLQRPCIRPVSVFWFILVKNVSIPEITLVAYV